MFEEKPSVDNQGLPPYTPENILRPSETKTPSQNVESNQKVLTATKHLRNDSKTIQLELRHQHPDTNDLEVEMTILEDGQMVLRHRRANSNDLKMVTNHSRNNSRDLSKINILGRPPRDIKAIDYEMLASRRHSTKDLEMMKNRDNEYRSKSTTHSRNNSKDMRLEFDPKHRRTTSQHIQIENYDMRPEESQLIPNINFLSNA